MQCMINSLKCCIKSWQPHEPYWWVVYMYIENLQKCFVLKTCIIIEKNPDQPYTHFHDGNLNLKGGINHHTKQF